MKQINPNPKPMFYACLLGGLRKIAISKGYALAVHGTCASDMDLIAVRWADECASPDNLAEAFYNELSLTMYKDFITDHRTITTPERRYDNQLHYTIPIGIDWYVDLTVIESPSREGGAQ